MRVLQIGKFYPPHRGGIETHLQVLCGELRKKVALEVIVASKDRRHHEDFVDGVPVSRLATYVTAFGTSFCPSLTGRIRRSAADLVHIHLPNPAAVAAYLASGHSGRVIAGYHSDIVRQKTLAALLDPMMQLFFRRCSAIILSSPNYLGTSRSIMPHRERCFVVPYGISLRTFLDPDRSAIERVRREHGERLILSVGRLVYYKGFEYLIRAMASVNGKLLLAGDGPLRSELMASAHAAGVASRVVFLNGISDEQLAACYGAADVFVLPSILRSESFGIVQVEAMASGKPVINTSINSGVPFVSLDGQTGLTVAPGDSGALASAMNLLLDNTELRTRLGNAARQRAQDFFSAERMTSQILDIYCFALKQEKSFAIPAGVV